MVPKSRGDTESMEGLPGLCLSPSSSVHLPIHVQTSPTPLPQQVCSGEGHSSPTLQGLPVSWGMGDAASFQPGPHPTSGSLSILYLP